MITEAYSLPSIFLGLFLMSVYVEGERELGSFSTKIYGAY
jgi:hypothetical protein